MSQRNQGHSHGAVMTTILNTMASKKGDYKEGVVKNHSLCMGLADRVAVGGSLENDLLAAIQGEEGGEDLMPKEQIQQFLAEQRNRLKALTERNVEREGKIDDFVGAITQLKQKVANDDDEDLYKDGTQTETIIQELMKEQENSRKKARTDPKDSDMFRALCDRMGEKVDTGKGGVDDDDDDIEVIRNNNDNGAELKCPVTAMMYENPVKSTTCGHVFSKAGIEHIMGKKGRCACPVSGCNNTNMTMAELKDDLITENFVKRAKRKQAAEQEHKIKSQAFDMDDDDEDEE